MRETTARGSVCLAFAKHLTCPLVGNPHDALWMTHQVHVSSLSAQARRPYPPGYGFPSPFGRRPSLLGPSCTRCGVKPLFRRSSSLLDQGPDHNGVAAFRTSEIRSGWVLPVLRGPGVLARDGGDSRAPAGVGNAC